MLWITLPCMVTIEEKPTRYWVIPAITRTWRVLINFTRRRSEDYMDENSVFHSYYSRHSDACCSSSTTERIRYLFCSIPKLLLFCDQFSVLVRINKIWFGLYEELFIIPIQNEQTITRFNMCECLVTIRQDDKILSKDMNTM